MRPAPPLGGPSRRQVLRAGLAVATTLLAGCVPTVSSTPNPSPEGSGAASGPPVPGSPSPGASPSPPAPASFGALSLRQVIGGLLIVGFRGMTVDTTGPVRRAIAEDGLGGVILFNVDGVTGGPRNIESPEQLQALTAGLQALAGDRRLIVAIDQEGGQVSRLSPKTGFPSFESEADVGAAGDPARALGFGQRLGATLAGVGVNLNLAPVVDLNVNPTNPAIGALDRSFSADPALVSDLALAEIKGHHEFGVATTLKHFPGLGSVTVNTDHGVADASRTWTEAELEPYRALIASGQVDAIMSGHVIVRRLGGRVPASLSATIVTDLLRGSLGWDGPVVTDSLEATAIADRYPFDEALALAIEAGNDLLLLANQRPFDRHIAARAIEAIEGHVVYGRISRERLETSLARIARLTRA